MEVVAVHSVALNHRAGRGWEGDDSEHCSCVRALGLGMVDGGCGWGVGSAVGARRCLCGVKGGGFAGKQGSLFSTALSLVVDTDVDVEVVVK